MATLLIHSPAIFTCVFLLIAAKNIVSSTHYQTPSFCSNLSREKSVSCEVEEAKLKIARLESILDEKIAEVDAKSRYLKVCEEKFEVLTEEIDRLQSRVSSLRDDYSGAILKQIAALEEEVRLLWEASRKINFEIYDLEYKALDADRRSKEVTSQVEEMTEIVSEQWIQIQHLEQAVSVAEIRASNIRKKLWRRCPFVKGILGHFLRYESMLARCKSQVLPTFAAAKHYHHQLQGLIRQAMESNAITAALGHEEVVFFVASALVAFPLMIVCNFLLSQFK